MGDGKVTVGESWSRNHLHLEWLAVCHLVVVEGGSVCCGHHTVAVSLGYRNKLAVSLLLGCTFTLQQGDAWSVGQVDIDVIDIDQGILLHLMRRLCVRNHYQTIDIHTLGTLNREHGISPLSCRNRSG